MDPEIKKKNFIFPTKHVIPESLKFSHWLSEIYTPENELTWNLKITWLTKENHLNQASILGFQPLVFGGLYTPSISVDEITVFTALKTNGWVSKMMGLGKGNCPLNMATVGIYVRFLGFFLIFYQPPVGHPSSVIWRGVWSRVLGGFSTWSRGVRKRGIYSPKVGHKKTFVINGFFWFL